jgi:lipopolysaccharide/colanic/teichoic acid biosynthesis glycosyltransferase
VSPRPYRGKRFFDLSALVLGSPLWLPALGLCAGAVGLTSGRPILFTQQRVGRDGRPYMMLKFRTMKHAAEGNPIFPDESVVTPVGRFLRRTSLDELPQLLNVARGDMSIVGPRPALAYQVDRFTPEQRRRMAVRPGMTGLAQVRGRNRIPWAKRIEHDLEYLQVQSPWTDVRILFQTLGVALTGAGTSGHPPDDPIAAIEGPTHR